MNLRRFYANKQDFNNKTVVLYDDEHNHIRNVLRMQVGDSIVIVCGDEFDYVCEILEINKSSTVAKIIKTEINKHNSKNMITVFQGLIRKENMSLVVQKLTELGVAEFVPIETRFITAKDKFNKSEKLQKVSIQSIKQCKRSIPMVVHNTKSFKEFINALSDFDVVVFANETENVKKLSELNFNKNLKIALIVGSEGGFSEEEIEKIISAGGISVSLGARILRAETAAIALTTLAMHKIGEI